MAAEDLKGPFGDLLTGNVTRITAIAVTTASAVKDPSDSSHFNSQEYQSRFVRIICDQAVTYFWSNNAAATVSDTAVDGTSRGQQGDQLPANTPREEMPTGRYFVAKAAAAGTVRLCIVDRTTPL